MHKSGGQDIRKRIRRGGGVPLKDPPTSPLLLFSVGRVEKVKELGVIEKRNVFFFLPSSEEYILFRKEKKHTQSSVFPKDKKGLCEEKNFQK